jgi:hypothetical protein
MAVARSGSADLSIRRQVVPQGIDELIENRGTPNVSSVGVRGGIDRISTLRPTAADELVAVLDNKFVKHDALRPSARFATSLGTSDNRRCGKDEPQEIRSRPVSGVGRACSPARKHGLPRMMRGTLWWMPYGPPPSAERVARTNAGRGGNTEDSLQNKGREQARL